MYRKKEINLYGLGCTIVMQKINSEIDKMAEESTLEVNCDCKCALSKIRGMCMSKNYPLEIYRLDKNSMKYIIKKV